MRKQWADVGGGFTPAGATISGLQPGYYRPEMSGGMMPQLVIAPVPLVTDDLLVLEDSPVQHVVSGIQKFWAKAPVYKKNGLIHKRGYLLEGPPGTGKTSIANLIAKFFAEHNGIVFFAGLDNIANGAVGAAVSELRSIQDNPLLVIVEEFDQIMLKQQFKDTMMQLMDGAQQVNNVVYLLATNYLEKIDQRFTKRPSRVDEIIHVGQPSEVARRSYLRTILHKLEVPESELESWVKATEGLLLSHLKEAVIAVQILEQPLAATIERLKAMVPEANKKNTLENQYALAQVMENLTQAAFVAANAAEGNVAEEYYQ